MKPTLKILTVDDHPLYAEGISACLQKLPLVKQVDSCNGYDELQEKLKSHQPHLVFLELNLQKSKVDAFTICREITKRHLHIFVVMLSHYNDRELIQRAQASGAGAYFDKRNSTEALYEFMDDLCDGCINHFYVKMANDDKMQLPAENDTLDLKQLLTRRELEVMRLIVKGWEHEAIECSLHISYSTYWQFRASIFKKLNVKNDVQLTHFVYVNQLTESDFKVNYIPVPPSFKVA